jgi:hypothetical protein
MSFVENVHDNGKLSFFTSPSPSMLLIAIIL